MRSSFKRCRGLRALRFCHTLSYMNASTASSSQTSSRINARLDAQAMAHLASLKATLGVPVSDIVRASLAMYDAAMTKKPPAPLSALGKHIGKYDSGSDGTLSVTYKAEIAKYLDRKYPRQ